MADQENPVPDSSAETAYAAAAEAVPVKAEAPAEPAVVEFPAKAKRAKPAPKSVAAPAKTALPKAAAPAITPVAKPAAPKPVAPAPVPAEPVVVAAPAPKPTPAAKPVIAKPVLAKVRKPVRPAAAKPAVIKRVPASRPAAPVKTKPAAAKPRLATAKSLTEVKLKEKPMATAPQFTQTLQNVASETQAKAKQAFEKGSAFFGDYAEFAKGNVEAVVESSKILASGVQSMGSTLVAETKTAFETATADAKQVAAVKSPSDLLTLQSEILRRNFDSAVALSTKNGEALIKLASDTFAPISGRFSLAIEKLKTAA